MYIPKKYQQGDTHKFKELMIKYPFATLISHHDAGLDADHIPLLLKHVNGKDVLQGHIAKANPLWTNVKDDSEVLVVFNGPNCYISPNYYPTKQEHGRVVPTWNYVVVQVKGIISIIHDDQWKLKLIENLTNLHEASQPTPWTVTDAPTAYIDKMLPAIVGLEVDILSITGKWKVSQNQPEINKQGVYTGLSQETESNAHKIAEWVKEHMDRSE
ncbi:MAG: transcriptional regulator [Alteromonadaceae bacterium]|jgi:transcriptional regulator